MHESQQRIAKAKIAVKFRRNANPTLETDHFTSAGGSEVRCFVSDPSLRPRPFQIGNFPLLDEVEDPSHPVKMKIAPKEAFRAIGLKAISIGKNGPLYTQLIGAEGKPGTPAPAGFATVDMPAADDVFMKHSDYTKDGLEKEHQLFVR